MSETQPKAGAGLILPPSPFIPESRALAIAEGRHERPERLALEALLRAGDRVLELGAGIGYLGALAAKRFDDVQVLAYEANADLMPTITALYAANGLSTRARARNAIVVSGADAPKEVTFHIHGSYLGSSIFEVGAPHRPVRRVPTHHWKDVIDEFRPTFLLMDIEGAELDLLAEADLSALRAVVLEFHPRHYQEAGMMTCRRILRQAGLAPKHRYAGGMIWGLERVEGS